MNDVLPLLLLASAVSSGFFHPQYPHYRQVTRHWIALKLIDVLRYMHLPY